MKTFRYLPAITSLWLGQANSHSWVEQLRLIATNGTFVGEPGYPRGNILRTDPAFNDPAMTYLLPPNTRPINIGILPTDNICAPSQRNPNQTKGSPRLKAPPGGVVALRYQENGHVTLPDAQPGKPENRGGLFVYGTTDPRPNDKLLSIHKKWNADGTGGDGRGILLANNTFDDGRCYQVNGDGISTSRQAKYPHEPDQLMGADMWCQQDIALPQNAPVGKPYTLYWVWDWPTAAEVDPGLPKGKQELYTTCMDVDVIAESPIVGTIKAASFNEEFIEDQSLNNAAIHSQVLQLDHNIMIPDGSKDTNSESPSSQEASNPPPSATSTGTVSESSQSHGTGRISPTTTGSSSPRVSGYGYPTATSTGTGRISPTATGSSPPRVSGCGYPTATPATSGAPAIISLPSSLQSGFGTVYTASATIPTYSSSATRESVPRQGVPRFRFHRGPQFPQVHNHGSKNDAPRDGEEDLVRREPNTSDHAVEPPTYTPRRIPIRKEF